jgi:hypothetical protein
VLVSFVSPLSALVALAVILPLAAYVATGRHAERAAAVLGLPPESRRRRFAGLASLTVIGLLLGLAAAQPVLTFEGRLRVRKDVQAYVVFDTSKSMLASERYGAPNRLARAKSFAIRLRSRLADIPFGIASLTDRTLPHLFPGADAQEFAGTARRAIGIERPPAEIQFTGRATTMQALAAFSTQDWFGRAPHRLIVVLTDGESRPFVDASIGALFRRARPIDAIFVHVWSPTEQIFLGPGVVDPDYAPDPQSDATIRGLANVAGGQAFEETDLDAAARAARAVVGEGPTIEDRPQRKRVRLAPYLALGAFVPLSLLLYRRNL